MGGFSVEWVKVLILELNLLSLNFGFIIKYLCDYGLII